MFHPVAWNMLESTEAFEVYASCCDDIGRVEFRAAYYACASTTLRACVRLR